jgi:ribonuclease Y
MSPWLSAFAGLLGIALGYVARTWRGRSEVSGAERRARQALADAEREAKSVRKEAEIAIKAEKLKAREDFESATDSRRKELLLVEDRLSQREANVDRKAALMEKKEAGLEQRQQELAGLEQGLKQLHTEQTRLVAEERERLQRLAGMSAEQAKDALMARIEREARAEIGAMLRRMQEDARENAKREAAKIVTVAIQRYAGTQASDTMTSPVALPSDEMKGRVIGREGRNIRSLEACTGVTVLIDDTPEAVVISSFDPVRREVARQALELLVADGRIHPGRIEEVVAEVQANMEDTIRRAGEEAIFKVGIQSVDPELARTLGRLKYRTSYSQNVLNHSIEVAHLIGLMAAELGLDVEIAKRVGLFHDIGKALDHEVEGGHAIIGGDFLKRCGESADVVNGVAAHHHDVESINCYAALAAAADAISGSRPGARTETTEIYIKRLERLEGIANSYEGVKKSYAIQAGREVRVFVEPARVDDNEASLIARNISKQIHDELQYPGQIRVVVIRETRCVEYAR